MKFQKKNWKSGSITLIIENNDDLWILQQILDPSDKLKSQTQRKIKLEGGSERTTNIIRKWVTIEITSEKIKYEGDSLRVTGPITQGPEDIARGTYHTLNVEANSKITIFKQKWLSFQRQRVEEATKAKPPSILLTIFDREDATFTISTKAGYKKLSTIRGAVEKKDKRVKAIGNFFADIIKQIEVYNTRHKPQHIVLASPSFWKDELMKQWTNKELKDKLVPATCSSADDTAVNEVLQRPEVQTILQQERTAQEAIIVEKIFKAIAKEEKVCYGKKDAQKASEAGAIETLAITDSTIQEARENNKYEEIDKILKSVDQCKGKIMIISAHNDAGKRLNGLGGIAGLLRYDLRR